MSNISASSWCSILNIIAHRGERKLKIPEKPILRGFKAERNKEIRVECFGKRNLKIISTHEYKK